MTKSQKLSYPAIPTPGAILHYLVRAVGLPTAEIPGISNKDFERLSGEQLSDEKFRMVVSAIVDRLVSPDQTVAAKLTPSATAVADSTPDSPAAFRFIHDSVGNVVFDPAELARVILEFLGWNQILRAELGKEFAGPRAREIWIKVFVVPYLAGKAAELKALDVDWEAGMPGGQHWYLPKGFGIQKGGKLKLKQLPLSQVLEWWQDLLGQKFEDLDEESRLACGDPMDVARQIRRWRAEGQKISFATIERWTQPHRRWRYSGAFQDDEELSLPQRWQRCRAFLEGKRMAEHEKLANEIPAFTTFGISFNQFFQNADPQPDAQLVEVLIQRVAYRWCVPTNLEVRARLMVALAAQTAITDMEECIGTEKTLNACGWFARIFDVIRPIIASDELKASESRETAMRMLHRDFSGSRIELDVIETIFAGDPSATLQIMHNCFEQGGRE